MRLTEKVAETIVETLKEMGLEVDSFFINDDKVLLSIRFSKPVVNRNVVKSFELSIRDSSTYRSKVDILIILSS